MTVSDFIGGFALAAFFSIPIGLLGMLYARLTEKPKEYMRDEPLLPRRDIKLVLTIAVVFTIVGGPVLATLFRTDRMDAESWQSYTRDHKCVVMDSRTKTEYRSGGYPGTSQPYTVTEYLWRCESGDEHWHR